MAQPLSIPAVGSLVDPVNLRGIEDVHLDGDYVYLPCREGKRISICSIQDPGAPQLVSSFTHPDLIEPAGLARDGNTLYVTSQQNHRLLIIDASDKSALRMVGSVAIGGSESSGILYKVAYRDGYCYVAHQAEKKLYVVDVRNPELPNVVGSVAVTTQNDGPFSVTMHDDYALVGTIFGQNNRMAVVDIKNPTHPRLVTHIAGPAIGHTSGQIVDSLFYSVNYDANSFMVFDVADPEHPTLLSTLIDERLGNPNRCVISGDRAYLPMINGDGVAVVDIADPSNPRFLMSFTDPVMDKAYGIAVRENLLLVGARDGNSLSIFNLQSIPEPSSLGAAAVGLGVLGLRRR